MSAALQFHEIAVLEALGEWKSLAQMFTQRIERALRVVDTREALDEIQEAMTRFAEASGIYAAALRNRIELGDELARVRRELAMLNPERKPHNNGNGYKN